MIRDHRALIVASVTRGPSASPHCHADLEDATTEAKRLALENRGEQFVIYAPVRVVQTPPDVIVQDIDVFGVDAILF